MHCRKRCGIDEPHVQASVDSYSSSSVYLTRTNAAVVYSKLTQVIKET